MHLRTPELDHLVIAAPSLEAGVIWCEQTLGVTPGPGGEHPLMGTHNRLALISSHSAPHAYLEIIAINKQATPTKPGQQSRWFGLDEPAMQQQLQQFGPQLIHWVARVADLPQALAGAHRSGWDLGVAVHASRMTSQGLLSWSIAVRPDGRLQAEGVMPTLIGWGQETHPTYSMAPSGLAIRELVCCHPQAAALNLVWHQAGGQLERFRAGPAKISALLETPRGSVLLESSPAAALRPGDMQASLTRVSREPPAQEAH